MAGIGIYRNLGISIYLLSDKGDYSVYGSDIIELKDLMIPKKASL